MMPPIFAPLQGQPELAAKSPALQNTPATSRRSVALLMDRPLLQVAVGLPLGAQNNPGSDRRAPAPPTQRGLVISTGQRHAPSRIGCRKVGVSGRTTR